MPENTPSRVATFIQSALTRNNAINLVAMIVPLALYAFMALKLSSWIIDDAGITFAYSRSLAGGDGIVSQPGMPPVEGFSNPLWMFLMVPFFWLGLFEPIVTSKIISFVFVACSFWIVHRLVLKLTDGSVFTSFVVLTTLAFNSSFVIWSTAGLENPLYVTLVLTLVLVLINSMQVVTPGHRVQVCAGILVAAIALTRPDGILYAILPFAAILIRKTLHKTNVLAKVIKESAIYAVTAVITFGSYVLFRVLYFGDVYPNTYHVKGGPSIATAFKAMTLQGPYLDKLREFSVGVAGSLAWLLVPLTILLGIAFVFARDGKRREITLVLGSTLLALYIYMVLPIDWMGEFRFASPFFPLYYAIIGILAILAIRKFVTRAWLRVSVGVLLSVCLIGLTAKVHQPRLIKYAKQRKVDFTRIVVSFANKFDYYAEFLDLDEASLLVPDMGGTLYYSQLRIYDLGGLCDKTIATTRGKDQQRFYDYVFGEIKPTFIHTHGFFTAVSKFDDDPRFLEDYVPINQYDDQYVKRKYKADRISGDFVRKDHVLALQPQIDSLQQGLKR